MKTVLIRAWFFWGGLLALALVLACLNWLAQAADLSGAALPQGASDIPGANAPPGSDPLFPSIFDTGGQVQVFGHLQTTKDILSGAGYDTVWISTPATPALTHAKIYLLNSAGSKSQLMVLFDNGTARILAAN